MAASAVIKEYTQKYPNLSDSEAKAMAERMFDYDSRLAALKKKYYKKIQQGASGIYGDEVLSVGSSHRLADGYASRSFASSTHAGKVRRAGKIAWQNRLSNEARSSSSATSIRGVVDVPHDEA